MTIEQTLHALVSNINEIYGELIVNIILYGSVARNEDTEESDIDVAVILKNGASPDMYDALLDAVVDLELECGKVLSVVRIDSEKYDSWNETMPFYRNIKNDGVILWPAA